MPIPVQCPGCSAKLNAPDPAAGKKVKCPKCAAPITVPAPAPSFEVVDEPAVPAEPEPARTESEPEAVPPKRGKREEEREADADEDAPRKKKQRDEDDKADEAPRKKKRRGEDSEEDESPKKRRKVAAEAEDADERPRKKNRRDEDEEDDDKPRKKKRRDDETEGSGSKKKWLFIGGGAALLLGGIVLAIVLSQSGSSGDKTDNKDNKDGTPAVVADDIKVIPPRVTFATKFPGKEPYHREVSNLALNADGSTVVATNNAFDENRQSQAWSVRGEAKKLDGYEGDILALSSDGTLLSKAKQGKFGTTGKPEIVDVATGAASTRPFLTVEKNSMRTAAARFNWNSSFDSRKQSPFKVFHYEEPSGKALGPYDGGDEDRVALVPPVKNGTELVYAIPRANKVRVFDFSSKSVTREFALANPRAWNGKGDPFWNCFRVSPDAKWIAAVRVSLARDPDPTEIFDGTTGAVVATIPPRAISDLHGTFLINRAVYVGPGGTKAKDFQADSKDLMAYDINKKQFVAVFRGGHKVYVNQIALSADGKVMATACTSGEVCIWDLAQLP